MTNSTFAAKACLLWTIEGMLLSKPNAADGGLLYPPFKIAAVITTLTEEGIGAGPVLAGTNLDLSMLHDAATRVSVQQFLHIYRNARALSSDPALGFRIGAKLHASSYGVFGYSLLCLSTLRESIAHALRFTSLTGPVTTLRYRETGESFAWEFPSATELRVFGIEPAMANFMTEMHFANTARLHADVMGADCLPSRLEVAGAAPPHAGLYREYLGCRVYFGKPAHVMHFPAVWLDRSPRLANPLAATALVQDCAALLAAQRRTGSASAQVARVLVERPEVFPALQDVAACLHLSSRTLRRRLELEGTSYQQLLDEARKSQAIDYLQRTNMSTEHIARALGFSNATCFRRAFRRWTQKGPQDFRRAV